MKPAEESNIENAAARRPEAAAPPEPAPSASSERPILGQTLTVFTSPAQTITKHARKHYHRRYHGRYRFARWVFVLDVALLGLVLSLAAFTAAEFLARPRVPEGIRVILRTDPQTPRAGDHVVLAFEYQNRSRSRRGAAAITLRLPRGFLLDEKDVMGFDRETRTFAAGALAPGEGGRFEISGILIAYPGVPAEAAAIIASRDERSGARDVRAVRLPIPVGSSGLGASLDLPETLIADQEAEMTLSYQNSANTAIGEAVLVPVLPEGSAITGSSPALVDGSWRILDIPSGGTGRVILRFTTPGAPAAVSPGIRISFRALDELIPQGEVTRSARVVTPGIRVSAADADPDPSVGPGETRIIRVEAENTGATVFRDARLSLRFDPGWIDFPRVSGAGTDANSIFVTSEALPALREVRPGDRVSAEFSVPVISGIEADPDAARPLILRARPSFAGETEEFVRIPPVDGPAIGYQVRTGLRLRALARYTTPEGEQIGRGSLPPKVGKTTRYWIFLEAEAGPNDARDVVVEGRLPGAVSWIDLQSVAAPGAEPLSYDRATRTVRWKIGALPFLREEPYGAAFAVELTPVAEQAGAPAILFDSITIEGADAPTGRPVSKRAASVTTELLDGGRAAGKGAVAD